MIKSNTVKICKNYNCNSSKGSCSSVTCRNCQWCSNTIRLSVKPLKWCLGTGLGKVLTTSVIHDQTVATMTSSNHLIDMSSQNPRNVETSRHDVSWASVVGLLTDFGFYSHGRGHSDLVRHDSDQAHDSGPCTSTASGNRRSCNETYAIYTWISRHSSWKSNEIQLLGTKHIIQLSKHPPWHLSS